MYFIINFGVFLGILLCVYGEKILLQTPSGLIMGTKEYGLHGTTFYAFQQVPYAKPPIGNLRFADPEPAEKWKGILDATKSNKICYQQNNMLGLELLEEMETEDCLYLNVYTPKNPSNNSSLPVLIYIHGGGFVSGSGNFDFFGPHYFMEHNIILVTPNYRLGPFGFLTTGDEIIPGNFGLKDQQLALKWVKNNIKYFGGNPQEVTLFGQSAGAASVTFHLLNKESASLFRAAIAQSGSMLTPWSFQRDHNEIAYKVGCGLDNNFKNTNTSQDLLKILRSKPASDINRVAASFKESIENDQILQGFWFTPTVEPAHPKAFITEKQFMALENGKLSKVPLMIGITSEELISKANDPYFLSKLQQYDNDLSMLINKNMHIEDRLAKREAGETLRRIYTDGLLHDNPGLAVRLFSDISFNMPIITHAKIQSKFSRVYFYQFSYSGLLGGIRPNIDGADRTGHSDDNHYLWTNFKKITLENYSEADVIASIRFRTLITNFVKYLNPTPQLSELFDNVIWPTVNFDDFKYLDINDTMSIKRNPKGDVYPKLVNFYETMAVKPFDTF
ncbi:juvenile hormone esterase-like isoform X1 [Diorhabda carinulata]|uniref:juvenile hormone esterase-like isoform X1 n=1 Tax=Diorhabda carinulata TaxID=1163345 RepID=UPI0025A0D55F|nr:juvenile hormone esterase-like isoform X1 [Diorhabda carinulata]